MKKTIFNFLFFFAAVALFVSCDDDEDKPAPIVYGEAEMVSFGFYAEDNAGNIFNDYVVEGITGSFSVGLPDYVDKSALIARFVVTQDDTVFVGSNLQESGVSANDFTTPVDYLVTEGTNNAIYTVTIENLPDAVWSSVASDTTDMREIVLKVNPVDNMPYIAYVQSAEESDNYKAGVLKLDENMLSIFGGTTASEGRAANVSLAFNSEGNPYISFADYTNETSSGSVMSYNGTAWNYVGNKGITDVRITYNDVILKPDGNPMLFAYNNSAGALARRELNISDYDGAAWQTSIVMPGRPATSYAYYPTAKRIGDVIYLGILNVNESTVSVYKNEGGTWTTIAEGYRDENATTIYLRDFDMDVDNDGNVYIVVGDDTSGEDDYRPKLMKYNAGTQSWSNMGSPINVDFPSTREFSLAISPAGIPHLMYRNNSMYPEMVSFDNDTQDWTTPVVIAELESEDLFMDFAPNGVGYAAFTASNIENTVLYKYDIPTE